MDDSRTIRNSSLPRTVRYIDVADRLRSMAAEVQTPEARRELAQLAKLYERLANTSARYG